MQAFADEVVGEDGEKMAAPGKAMSHHICRLLRPASRSEPQLGLGGGAPKPRKLSPLSSRMAEAMPNVIGTRTGASAFENVVEHEAEPTDAERPGGGDEIGLAQADELAAREPRDAGPAREAEHGHQMPDRGPSSTAIRARISTKDGMHITNSMARLSSMSAQPPK